MVRFLNQNGALQKWGLERHPPSKRSQSSHASGQWGCLTFEQYCGNATSLVLGCGAR
jgi:hypothetical protein